MKTFEPLRKASDDFRQEAAQGRGKLFTELRKLDNQRSERLLSDSQGTPEYRKEEAELWQQAMTIYGERLLFVQRLRARQSEAYANAYARIQQEIQRFQHEQRIGVVLNCGLPFELPELEPLSVGAHNRPVIGA
jgi:Skp family chaperone for outer membrane proteins